MFFLLNIFILWVCLDKQVTVAYNKDNSTNKLNLGVGAYRTEVFFVFFFSWKSNFLCILMQ